MSTLNADDIRRIIIEALLDLGLIIGDQIANIDFVDEISKDEILQRKIALMTVEQVIES